MDGWSIHTGSCGYGYQWPDQGTGWDVAGIADASPEFAGSCGRCYEVKCRNADFQDGYGEQISRSSACYDADKTVVVKTSDNCPCNYESNSYSNQRWCCGDGGLLHMDLSLWSFEKLASTSLGVIGISYRQVACDYQPTNPAPALDSPSPGESPPSGATRPGSNDCVVRRFDDAGARQGAVTPCSGGQQGSNSSSSPSSATSSSSSPPSPPSVSSSTASSGSNGGWNRFFPWLG